MRFLMKEKIESSAAFLKTKGIDQIELGVVLGTGLDGLASDIELLQKIPYHDIPHFPTSTQTYQKGRLLYGTLNGITLLAFQGRFHLYEGYDFFEITFWVRVFAALGGKRLIISNAAGAVNLNFNKGELMLLTDHLNLQGGSPLALKGMEALGERFVDLSQPYSKTLRAKALEIARKNKIQLHRGVYAAVVGPQLETAAEYRYLKIIGADAVGMSTVPEVIVAKQLGIEVIAFSVLTDVCDPENLQAINIPDIMAMAKKGEQDLIKIVKGLLSKS
jgi:purine-nucleoside phosphorylase